MKLSLKNALFGVVVVLVAVLAVINAAQSGGASTVRNKLTIVAPAAPGGGWDGLARDSQQTMRGDGIVNNVQVVNVPGAGGTIGLAQLVEMHGRDDVLMVTGSVMLGAISVGKTNETLADVTPIARLAEEYSVLVVPVDSPIQTFDDFIEAWKADPTGLSIAGGSLGSNDHLMTGMLAREIGVEPSQANYVVFSGGGDAMSAILSNSVDVALGGYPEFAGQIEAGTLRILATSAPEPVPTIDAPTFIESGVNVSMANWRGFLAPPGLSEEQTAELIAIVDEMHETEEWQAVIAKNGWTDTYLTGDAFGEFIAEQQADVDEIVKELGL